MVEKRIGLTPASVPVEEVKLNASFADDLGYGHYHAAVVRRRVQELRWYIELDFQRAEQQQA